MKLRYLLAIAVAALAVAGCKHDTDDGVAVDKTIPQAPAGTSKNAGTKINDATVVNAPTDQIPPGGIVIKPANPDDPKFKADPKLHGGG